MKIHYHSRSFLMTTAILFSLTLSSCSRTPRMVKSPTLQGMKSGLVGMTNRVIKSTPRIFKQQKPRYPAALPMKGYPGRKATTTAKTRYPAALPMKGYPPQKVVRTTKARYPAALSLRKNNSARTCPVPNNRVVLASKRTSVYNRSTPPRHTTPRITKVSYTAPVQRQQTQTYRRPTPQPVSQPQAPRLNPQQANQQLFSLAKNGNAAQISNLIAQGAHVNSANGSGETALHSAASTGNTSAAQVLLQRGANVNARTVRGWTPLHTAARFGRGNLVSMLLNNGAQSNIQNVDGKTPAQLASQANQQGIVAMLRR